MSYIAYSSTRHLLINSSDLLEYVPAAYVRVGYETDTLYTPSITIHQAGGSAVGFLGIGNSSTGNKTTRENASIQIDIFHRWTVLSSQRIGDIVQNTLIHNGWYRKISDNDDYVTDLECYNKRQVYNYLQDVDN